MKNDVLWDVMSFGSYKNRRFGGTYSVFLPSVLRLLVTANGVPTSQILSP
jgi:hypothetical protein